jgi:hypothetical protein
VAENWCKRTLRQSIKLPGGLTEQGIGAEGFDGSIFLSSVFSRSNSFNRRASFTSMCPN